MAFQTRAAIAGRSTTAGFSGGERLGEQVASVAGCKRCGRSGGAVKDVLPLLHLRNLAAHLPRTERAVPVGILYILRDLV